MRDIIGLICEGCGNDKFIAYLEAFRGRFEYKLILKCKECGLEYSVDIDNDEYEEVVKVIVINDLIKNDQIKEAVNEDEVYAPFDIDEMDEKVARELKEWDLFPDNKDKGGQ